MNRRKSKRRGYQPVLKRDSSGEVIYGRNGRPELQAIRSNNRGFADSGNRVQSSTVTKRKMTDEERERYGMPRLGD